MTRSALLTVAVVLAGHAASAQQAVIDHCRKTSSDADRIACLEAALLGKKPVQAEEEQTQIDTPSMDINTERGAVVEPAVEVAERNDAKPAGIGADQVIARNQTREDILEDLEEERGLVVASYDIVPYERLLIRLENGQVWRQSRGDKQKIRVDLRRNQTVDITESSLGGYKLRLNEMRRMIRVERVK